jgi:hypothetical protein
MTLYEDLDKLGAEIENHCSDLYVHFTPEVLKRVKASGLKFSLFTNLIDKRLWIEVPFAYDPWWDRRRSAGTDTLPE